MWLFCFQCWRIWRKACCWCPLHHSTPYYMWIVNFWLNKPIRINWYWRKHSSLKKIYPATIWFTQLVKIYIFSSKSEYFLKCLYSNFQTTLKPLRMLNNIHEIILTFTPCFRGSFYISLKITKCCSKWRMNYLFEIYGKNDVGTRAFSKMYCACCL